MNDIENPYQYDDDAWVLASGEFIHSVETRLLALWRAGASPANIAEDINAALDEAEIPFQVRVAP